MRVDLAMPSISMSFINCEKDIEAILRKLFIESKPYSDILKRLLMINQKDCLDNTESAVYNRIIKDASLKVLRDEGYIKLEPKLKLEEMEEKKNHIFISLDNFVPNATNPQYRDFNIFFDIVCHSDNWDLGNYRLRPLKIAGYIDGILNKAKMNNIGRFEFLGCQELLLDEVFSGYTLGYRVINDIEEDKKPNA